MTLVSNPDPLTIALSIILGLCIGSFLNVVIWRLPRGKSVLNPTRSFCTSCEKPLKAWHNIPVLSWLILGTKSACCSKPISGRYPFVELLSALGAVASYLYFGLNPTGILIYALVATLIAITFIDFDFKIIPNVINYPGMIIGLFIGIISQYTQIFAPPITQSALESLIGFLAGGGVFYAIFAFYYMLTKKMGLGGGDIKLMAFLGALLGWQCVAPIIFMGSLAGSVIGIAVMLLQGSGRNTEIPFGPWLALGAVLYIFTDIQVFRF